MDLQGLLAELCEQHVVPGAAAALVHGEEVTLAVHGVTSTTDPLPVTPETLFLIGSTTKTLTGTALVSALARKGIGLDEQVSTVLPDLPTDVPVTFLQLLNHTSGWRGDAAPDTGWGDDALRRGLDEGLRAAPQDFAPGTQFSYNNLALAAAGRAVEVLHGTTWEQATRELVTEPAGMADTCFLPWETSGRRTAVGHVLGDGVASPYVGWPIPRSMGPAGTAISTLHDQVRWAQWQLRGGSGPLDDATRLLMHRPTMSCRGALGGVGVSWLLQRRRGVDLVQHGGNVSNVQLSTFVLVPEHDLALVLMTNSAGGRAVEAELLTQVLDDVLHAPQDEPLPAATRDPEHLGRYHAGQWDLVVTVDGDGVAVQMDPVGIPEAMRPSFTSPPQPALLVGQEQLVLPSDPSRPVGCFVRREDGSLLGLEWMLRLSLKGS